MVRIQPRSTPWIAATASAARYSPNAATSAGRSAAHAAEEPIRLTAATCNRSGPVGRGVVGPAVAAAVVMQTDVAGEKVAPPRRTGRHLVAGGAQLRHAVTCRTLGLLKSAAS